MDPKRAKTSLYLLRSCDTSFLNKQQIHKISENVPISAPKGCIRSNPLETEEICDE